MTKDAHVLMISTVVDESTDEVAARLMRCGVHCTRIDTESYPYGATLTASVGAPTDAAMQVSWGAVALRDVTSIWYRRVRAPAMPAGMNPGVHDFCGRESRAALLGAILGLPQRVMSPPQNVWVAEHKLRQLSTAQAVGLQVPPTVVTNDPHVIREAFRRFAGQMIAKPVRSGYVDTGDNQFAVYTSQVLDAHLDDLSGAHMSPTIFQPLIQKRVDVRATFVGDELFVAEIDSQTDVAAMVDWRRTTNPSLPHRRASLPPDVEKASRHLMKELGLTFGAIDFIRTPDDRWIFLEVNPNGQWLWLDDMLGFGITDAVADWLAAVPT